MRLTIVVILLLSTRCFADSEPKADASVAELPVPQPQVDSVPIAEVKDEKAMSSEEGADESSGDIGFYHALIASLSVIIVSELGDKTWFIAAIMAMRHSRLAVFSGAMAALALMTVLSACLGWVTQIIPRAVTYYISTALFALFGLKMLHDGYHMSPNEGQEEYEEAQAEVQKNELEMESKRFQDMESGSADAGSSSTTWAIISFVSTIFIKSFTMTFVAEWGDRSQLTTIILAARENVAGVIIGGVAGHALCTGIAVIGGRLIAQRISVRSVTLIGGVVFLLFAVSALFVSPEPLSV
uniref:GDT1 family protein n=1 Tax=Steinernema glaseri TaxID=37863 RepID=A0A1I7Z458_9BILA